MSPPAAAARTRRGPDPAEPRTLCGAFQRVAARDPETVALREAGGGRQLTWREYAAQVREAAGGLAGLGVRRGDTVAMMMANRTEFYPLDVAAQHLGATSFSVYNTLSPAQLGHVLANSNARVVICEASYVERIRSCDCEVQTIICLDGAPTGTIPAEELPACAPADFDFEAHWQAIGPQDVATLIYTSGTTGNPKGVEMTHANLLFELHAVAAVLPVVFGDRVVSYLPSAHIADRLTALYFQMMFGTQVTTVDDPKRIVSALQDCRPTIWGGVPRVWEKLKAGIELAASGEPDERVSATTEWALSVARQRGEAELEGRAPSEELLREWERAEDAVLAQLRERFGLIEVRWAVSGAAPINRTTLAFFRGLGLPVTEIWGMSELSCIASVVPPERHRPGTVGRLLDGMEGRVAPDGEFLVRGPLVMRGYRGEPEKTSEAIDANGWLHTGDVITADDDGYLRIVDRKKELIINAAGKNMSPSNIENAVAAASPLIGSVVAIGEARAYIAALVVLDREVAAAVAAHLGFDDLEPERLAAHPAILKTVSRAVAVGNAELSRVEQVKRFTVVPEWWEPGGEQLTPTLKLRRQAIAERYAALIEMLYAAPRPDSVLEPEAPGSGAPGGGPAGRRPRA